MSSNILVDIGNTNVKWKFQGNYFLSSTKNFKFESLPKCSKIWVSNVSSKSFDLNNLYVVLVESQKNYKALTNCYSEPRLLGCDRWLGMIGSYEMIKGGSFILIDIGTAITIDIVNNFGMHLGGLIFPGLTKIRQTFNNFSVSSLDNINEIGQSTDKAWTIGTLNIVVNTINQKIHKLKMKLPNSSIILTGGGYEEIQDFLEFNHTYHENLVLDGLEFYVDYVG